MADLKSAIVQLYEDISLTDSLRDPAATNLLKWGEAQLTALAALHPQTTDFEPLFKDLRRLLKRVSRVVGERQHTPPQDQIQALTDIAEGAHALQMQPSAEGIEGLVAALPSLPEPDALQVVLDWLSPTTPAQTADPGDETEPLIEEDDASPYSTRLVPKVNPENTLPAPDTLNDTDGQADEDPLSFWGGSSTKETDSHDEPQ